jgi:hypothetical protein
VKILVNSVDIGQSPPAPRRSCRRAHSPKSFASRPPSSARRAPMRGPARQATPTLAALRTARRGSGEESRGVRPRRAPLRGRDPAAGPDPGANTSGLHVSMHQDLPNPQIPTSPTQERSPPLLTVCVRIAIFGGGRGRAGSANRRPKSGKACELKIFLAISFFFTIFVPLLGIME